jgi:carbon monoxide dehydrogenase subunit G
MASIYKEISINVKPEVIWDALNDIGNVHTRLFPGILTNAQLDGPSARIVTFSNGSTIREQVVDSNPETRRFVYAASGGVTTHHNASFQIYADGDAASRVVWISDFLPDDVAPRIQQLVDSGSVVMKQTLERPVPKV